MAETRLTEPFNVDFSGRASEKRLRFLHMADCHLGYRQYNLRERFNDFGQAFLNVIDTAIAEKVDFVLLAGDLFQKRAIDAAATLQAAEIRVRLPPKQAPSESAHQ